MEFCQKVKAGGNHLVVATAAGKSLGQGSSLRMREKELQGVLAEYQKLPASDRKPQLADASKAAAPRRAMPNPPPNGLIVRGFCTYMRQDEEGKFDRAKRFYYEQNPDRWAAETQSDMLWLTESEWKSLVPADPKVGDRAELAAAIQKRFFSTIGIDYMEGSVNSLPPRQTSLTLTVERITPEGISLRLDGYGRMGREFDESARDQARSRGCELRVLGHLTYNRKSKKFDRFDIAGVGQAWGNKMNYVRREIRGQKYPWLYGIACELVTGDTPSDRIPPYNMLHYGGSTGPYFSGSD